MGRGLSDLQKDILRICLRNGKNKAEGEHRREAEKELAKLGIPAAVLPSEPLAVECYYREVLVEHFGFPTRCRNLRLHPGDQVFDVRRIGRERYGAAQASLSRAVGRLEARGLVTVYTGARSHWTGCSLTEEGRKVAEKAIG